MRQPARHYRRPSVSVGVSVAAADVQASAERAESAPPRRAMAQVELGRLHAARGLLVRGFEVREREAHQQHI